MADPTIQRFPQGLLPALGIKASETPAVLDQRVSPSLEMMPFYLADRLETLSGQSAGISAPGLAQLQVPAGEYWWVWAINAIANNISAPGALIQLYCGVQTPDGSGPALASMLTPVASIATQSYHLGAVPPGGLLLRPGSFVFAGQDCDPGAQTFDLVVRCLFARLSSSS